MPVLSLNKGTTVIQVNEPIALERLPQYGKYLYYFPERNCIATGDRWIGALGNLDNPYVQLAIRFYHLKEVICELKSKIVETNNLTKSDRLFGVKEGVEEPCLEEDSQKFLELLLVHQNQFNDFQWIMPCYWSPAPDYRPLEGEWKYPAYLAETQSGFRRGLKIIDFSAEEDELSYYEKYPPIQILSDPITNTRDWFKMLKNNNKTFTSGWDKKTKEYTIQDRLKAFGGLDGLKLC